MKDRSQEVGDRRQETETKKTRQLTNCNFLLVVFSYLLPPISCLLPLTASFAVEKTLIYARGKDSIKLDPADITDGESAKATTQIFDTLVRYKADSTEVEPALATSWECAADGLAWTFRLREGVKFHDGSALDADAVVFSFERQRDGKHPAHTGDFIYWRDLFAAVVKTETVDAKTVRFTLQHPYAPFLSNLAMFSAAIVSPASFEKHGKGIAQHPVGTGPFRFESWERDARIVLSANPDHWDGRPKVDRLILQVIPDNTTRFLRLKDQKVHLIDGLAPQHVAEVRKDPGLSLYEAPGMNVAYLAFHNEKPPFTDPRVRRAVAHALDLPGLARALYLGTAAPAANPLPPTLWGHNDSLAPRPRDPDKARALLKEAGVAPGTKVELSAFSNPRPYMPEPAKVATYIKSALKEIGLDCTIQMRDWAEHLASVQAGKHQMCLLGWNGDNGDPDNFLYVLLDKENAAPPASNLCYYKSEATHDLLAKAQRESDPAKRADLYRKAQERIHADCPMVPLVHASQIMASVRRLKGFALHPVEIRLAKVDLE